MLAAMTLTLCSSLQATTGAWDVLPPLPRGIAGHAMAVDAEGGLWVAGGSYWRGNTKELSDEVWFLAPEATAWTQRACISGGWASGGSATDGHSLYLVGGLSAHGASSEIWRINLETGAAAKIGALPDARAQCAATLQDGSLWVLGGTKDPAKMDEADACLMRVSLPDMTTEQMSTAPSGGLINPVFILSRREVMVFSGSEWSAQEKRLTALGHVLVFSCETKSWRKSDSPLPAQRGAAGVLAGCNRMLLAGGVSSGLGKSTISKEVWIYDLPRNQFERGPDLPEPRLASAVASREGVVFISGGEDRPRGRTTDVWRLRP